MNFKTYFPLASISLADGRPPKSSEGKKESKGHQMNFSFQQTRTTKTVHAENACRFRALLLLGVFAVSFVGTADRVNAVNADAITDEKDDISPNRSMTYKSVDGIELKLDIFEPLGLKPTDHRPAIVFFFGGGWSGGDKKQFYQQAKAMAEHGMLAFSADYRVKTRNKTTPFECVKDGKSAIRWVREHAAELGVDPDRIVASGGSAGGHVAACTGVIEGAEEAGERTSVSSVPNAMILFNPVLDTTPKGYGAKSFKAEQQTDISPCHHVRKGIVPTVVFHGTADKTVPFENADRFTRLMKEAGNECVLVPFEGKDHGFFNGSLFRKSNGDADFETTIKRSVEFLKVHSILK